MKDIQTAANLYNEHLRRLTADLYDAAHNMESCRILHPGEPLGQGEILYMQRMTELPGNIVVHLARIEKLFYSYNDTVTDTK